MVPDSNDPLEQFFLYDGKELLVQKLDHDHRICQSTGEDKSQTYTILVREWRADTWEFGSLYEVTFDKLLTCAKLVAFLQSNLYQHIPLVNLWGTRVNILKPFIRSDLALKSRRGLNS